MVGTGILTHHLPGCGSDPLPHITLLQPQAPPVKLEPQGTALVLLGLGSPSHLTPQVSA